MHYKYSFHGRNALIVNSNDRAFLSHSSCARMCLMERVIEVELHRKYRDNEKVLARNLDAFRRGLALGKIAK